MELVSFLEAVALDYGLRERDPETVANATDRGFVQGVSKCLFCIITNVITHINPESSAAENP